MIKWSSNHKIYKYCFFCMLIICGIFLIIRNQRIKTQNQIEDYLNDLLDNRKRLSFFNENEYKQEIGTYLTLYISSMNDDSIVHKDEDGMGFVILPQKKFDYYYMYFQKQLFDVPRFTEYPNFVMIDGDNIVYRCDNLGGYTRKLIIDTTKKDGQDYTVYGHEQGAELIKANIKLYKEGLIGLDRVIMGNHICGFEATVSIIYEDGQQKIRLKKFVNSFSET